MEQLNFLLAWYNAPFLVALACCLLFALLQVLGGFGDHDAHAAHDADLHAADLHAGDLHAGDLHAGDLHAGDLHADSVVAAHGHAPGEGSAPHAGGFGGVLGALGVGRIPLMLILIALLGSFATVGLLINALLLNLTPLSTGFSFAVALIVALILSFVATSRLSNFFARLAGRSSTVVGFEHFVGRAGVVTSPSVSRSYGRVAVHDAYGTIHTVYAIVDGEPLPQQSEVALVAYDAVQRRFLVRALARK